MIRAVRHLSLLLMAALLAACDVAPVQTALPAPSPAQPPVAAVTRAQFNAVARQMGPVATRICRERSPHLICEFTVILDDRPGRPPNAFHTRDEQGRPIIAFSESLIRELRNEDEIALVFGHEAAHHIADHIPRMQREAQRGAFVGGLAAALVGADEVTTREIMDISATLGARRYAKPFELEADRIGAEIAALAGYDPLRGAGLFRRIPDPGNQFLGTHPPNSERLREVERAVARMRAGQPV